MSNNARGCGPVKILAAMCHCLVCTQAGHRPVRATARAVPIDTRVCCVLCRVAAVSVKPRQNAIDTCVLCRVAAVKPRQKAQRRECTPTESRRTVPTYPRSSCSKYSPEPFNSVSRHVFARFLCLRAAHAFSRLAHRHARLLQRHQRSAAVVVDGRELHARRQLHIYMYICTYTHIHIHTHTHTHTHTSIYE